RTRRHDVRYLKVEEVIQIVLSNPYDEFLHTLRPQEFIPAHVFPDKNTDIGNRLVIKLESGENLTGHLLALKVVAVEVTLSVLAQRKVPGLTYIVQQGRQSRVQSR